MSKQGGYALLVVMLVFLVLAVGGSHLFTQSRLATQVSGQQRDHAEALLLAESAMNDLFGRLISNADISGAVGSADLSELNLSTLLPDAMPALPLNYLYFIQGASASKIRSGSTPGILQGIANGEANAVAVGTVSGAAMSDVNRRVQDLFGTAVRPRLYLLNDTGLSMSSSTWAAVTAAKKAAVWVEITRSAADADMMDLYVQSTAQVGQSLAYTQRYLGSTSTGLLDMPTLGESCDAC